MRRLLVVALAVALPALAHGSPGITKTSIKNGSTPTSGFSAGDVLVSDGTNVVVGTCTIDGWRLSCIGGVSITPEVLLSNPYSTTTLQNDASGGIGSILNASRRLVLSADDDVHVSPGSGKALYITNQTDHDASVIYGPPGGIGYANMYVDVPATINGMVYWDAGTGFGFDFASHSTYNVAAPWGFSTSDGSVASATALPIQGNVIYVTGTTTITSLLDNDGANESYKDGACITLIFGGVTTLTDGNNIKAAGNFVTTADDTWTGCRHGGNWYETARSVN